MQVNLDLGLKLFSFNKFTDWNHHANSAWRDVGVSPHETLCIDQKNRVCAWGKHFQTARDEDAFPVDVYLMRADLQQNVGGHWGATRAAQRQPSVAYPCGPTG
jgi:hypothetical protein